MMKIFIGQNFYSNKFDDSLKKTKKFTSSRNLKQPSFRTKDFNLLFKEAKTVSKNIWTERGLQKNPLIENFRGLLDSLNKSEKVDFVKKYCELTGFPNLHKITAKIDSEILRAIEEFKGINEVKPVFVGYSSVSSLGREVAFPGSDADGLYIALGYGDLSSVKVSDMNFGINQRLVETSGEHFPEIFPLSLIMEKLKLADSIFNSKMSKNKIPTYEKRLYDNGASFVKAGEFNIDLANYLPNNEKMLVCKTGFFVELLRAGKILLNDIESNVLNKIKESSLYKYSNMYRQEGLKNNLKPKLQNRIEFSKIFEKLSDDEKFDVCKSLWEKSFGFDNDGCKTCYETFDMGDILEMYKKIGMN